MHLRLRWSPVQAFQFALSQWHMWEISCAWLGTFSTGIRHGSSTSTRSVRFTATLSDRDLPHGSHTSFHFIEVCKSANVEPLHWINVIELHQSWYHATDAGPFVIPALKATAALSDTTREGRSQSQLQNVRDSQSQSPSRSSIASSAPSSPSSVTSNVTSSVAQVFDNSFHRCWY